MEGMAARTQATCVSAWWPQPITPSVLRPAPRKMTGRDSAGSSRPQLSEPIGLDHRDELGGLGVEEADDERHAVRRRRVQLPAGEPEPAVGGGHVRERALGQPQPAPRRNLDLARRHPPEARFDRIDCRSRIDELDDVGLAEVEGHRPPV